MALHPAAKVKLKRIILSREMLGDKKTTKIQEEIPKFKMEKEIRLFKKRGNRVHLQVPKDVNHRKGIRLKGTDKEVDKKEKKEDKKLIKKEDTQVQVLRQDLCLLESNKTRKIKNKKSSKMLNLKSNKHLKIHLKSKNKQRVRN